MRLLLHACASPGNPALAAGDLAPLSRALAGAGHAVDLVEARTPPPDELDPLAWPDAMHEAARTVLADELYRRRPDALVVHARDSFLLAPVDPLPHPRTLIVGTRSDTLDPVGRAGMRAARALVIGTGGAVAGVAALVDGLHRDQPPASSAIGAIERWVDAGVAEVAAWRAALDRARRRRGLRLEGGP